MAEAKAKVSGTRHPLSQHIKSNWLERWTHNLCLHI